MIEATKHPTALISYSHDSPEHEQRVLEVCNRLRARGVDAFVDQFLPGAPSEGWPLWMERQIERRDFTLMVCTEAYRRRFMEDEASGVGRGVVWEARILRNLLYEDADRHGRIVPILLESDARQFVPTVFRGHFYDLGDERGFESLLRHLFREPGAEVGALGSLGPQGSRWSAFERPWLVPDAMRTRYFTGRENLLALLRAQLVERHRAALSGLGGIGKTQAAIEYAVRHRAEYAGGIFWTNAETASGLTSGFVEIAKTLRLAAAASTDQEQLVRAVLDWLNGTNGWLLIFDNVDDRRLIQPFIPEGNNGHVLITSRESVFQELGIARALEVMDLNGDEAVTFLLTRTGREIGELSEQAAATELAAELGNLPLALEQAAAYVAETNASFSDYLVAFRKRRVPLLEKASRLVLHDTIAITWGANFEAVERASPAAADALRTCAFLAPHAIPFELFDKGARALGEPIAAAFYEADPLATAELLRPLSRYSLIRSGAQVRAFGVHRLVQEIVRAALREAERKTYVERAVAALDAAIPEVEYAAWAECDRLVPHVISIGEWVDLFDVHSNAAGRLMNQAALYLRERGRYAEAQSLFERALRIRERASGSDLASVAASLQGLASVHWYQGRNSEAQSLYGRALITWERAVGPDHIEMATSLRGLATVHWHRGEYAEAQILFERALTIGERALGPDHLDVAHSLNNLANLYQDQGRLAESQLLHERALATYEVAHGPDHPYVAESATNLALTYRARGQYVKAKPLHERALAIRERAFGPEHPNVALALNHLANIHFLQGQYPEAKSLHERALAVSKRALGDDHPHVAFSFEGLASIYVREGRYPEAQSLYEKALAIWERAFGRDHAYVANSLDGLAEACCGNGQYAEAEALYDRAVAVRQRAHGAGHPYLAQSLVGLASLLKDQGRNAEALVLFERALVIRERTFAADHPEIMQIRKSLDTLRASDGATSQAAE